MYASQSSVKHVKLTFVFQAVIRIQCIARARVAWKASEYMRKQQNAEWEQLWNDRDRRLYYYNSTTGQSTYEEPVEVFRPLVRDLRSDALVQAWPNLDESMQGFGDGTLRGGETLHGIHAMALTRCILPASASTTLRSGVGAATASFMRDRTVCSCCEERKTMRICLDCPQPGAVVAGRATSPKRRMPTPYCFPCYAAVHSNDPSRINHQFQGVLILNVISRVY